MAGLVSFLTWYDMSLVLFNSSYPIPLIVFSRWLLSSIQAGAVPRQDALGTSTLLFPTTEWTQNDRNVDGINIYIYIYPYI